MLINKNGFSNIVTNEYLSKILNEYPLKKIFSIPGYSDLANTNDFKYTPGGITKIIFKSSHFTRNNMIHEVQALLSDIIESNKDFQVYYFDNRESDQFMKDFSTEIYEAYSTIKPTAYKSDFWRYCILYKYGGCYSDMGHIVLKSFQSITGNKTLVIPDEPYGGSGYHNGFMCVPPKHPLMSACIRKCLENIKKRYYGNSLWDITGPEMLMKVYIDLFHNKISNYLNYRFDFEDSVITDSSGEVIIYTKIPNYSKLFYDNVTRIKYHDYYYQKNVYK